LDSSQPRDTVTALALAAPFFIARQFGDHFAYCVEMSVAGAQVLQRRGIAARPLPCGIIGVNGKLPFAIGLPAHEVYQRFVAPAGSFEEWKRDWVDQAHGDGFVTHMVIEAEISNRRHIIDLTYGQLMKIGVNVPLVMIGAFSGWPSHSGEDWSLEYVDPAESELLAVSARVEAIGNQLTEDLDRLTDIALRAGGDPQNFHILLQDADKQLYILDRLRLESMMSSRLTPSLVGG
jgi:hypothetical protein